MRCGEGADSDSEQRPGAPTLTLLTTSPVPWRQCHPARAAKRPPPPGRCLPPPLPCPGVASSSWGATACLSPASSSSSPGSAEGWSHRLQLEDRPHCAVRRGAGENNNQTGKQSRPQRSKPPGAACTGQGAGAFLPAVCDGQSLPSLSQGGGAGSGQVFGGERETRRRLFVLRSHPLHGGTQQVCLLPLPTRREAADFNRCLALCTRTGAPGGCAASRVWCKARRVRLPFPASLWSLGVVPGTGSVAFACGINKICRWLG